MATTSYYPYVSGVSVLVRSLAQSLANQGNMVTVVAAANHWGETRHETKLDPGVSVIRISSLANPLRPGFRMPLIGPAAAAKLLESVEPDVVHVHDPLPVAWLLLRAARRRKILVVGTNHTQITLVLAYVWRPLRPLANWFMRHYMAWFYNQCDAVTVPSNNLAQWMRSVGVTQPIHVISNGVESTRFTPKRVARHDRSAVPLIITVGRIDKDKSVDVVIRSVAKLATTHPVRLVVIGDGQELGEMKQLVASLNLESVISFTGSIAHEDSRLVNWYQRTDVFVTASAIEAQGIVVLEAMAAGKPIVAAKAGA